MQRKTASDAKTQKDWQILELFMKQQQWKQQQQQESNKLEARCWRLKKFFMPSTLDMNGCIEVKLYGI